LSIEDQAVLESLARQEPVLRTALQAMMVARNCQPFLHRVVDTGANAVQPILSGHEHALVHQRLAGLSGVADLEQLALLLQAQVTDAADSSERRVTVAMADMIGEEAWSQLRAAGQAVHTRMSQPDFSPGCSDAAMATVAARLQCEAELAGRGAHVKTAGQCCVMLMHGLETRVHAADSACDGAVDGWWRQFERVMGAPLQALLAESLVRQLVARSLEQARDLLGPAMFTT